VTTSATRSEAGHTLIEVMVALAIVLIGTAGLLSIHGQGQKMNGDAMRMTRAITIAQDLLGQVETWPFTDARLTNTRASNDAAIGDPAFEFETLATPPFDLDEAGIVGGVWTGIPTPDLAGGGYERFLSVAYPDDLNVNGRPDNARIAVIVRFPSGSRFRRVVLLAVKRNPADWR